jgi:hypothetical protein
MTYLVIIHFDDGEFIHENYETFENRDEAIELAKSECLDRFTSVSVYQGEYVEWGEQEWLAEKKEEERLKKEAERVKKELEQKEKERRKGVEEKALYIRLKAKYEGEVNQ